MDKQLPAAFANLSNRKSKGKDLSLYLTNSPQRDIQAADAGYCSLHGATCHGKHSSLLRRLHIFYTTNLSSNLSTAALY